MVKRHDSAQLAYYIIQIGTLNTIKTYPLELQKKILLIRQTSHEFKFNIAKYIEKNNKF
jgi:hypothetical protein